MIGTKYYTEIVGSIYRAVGKYSSEVEVGSRGPVDFLEVKI